MCPGGLDHRALPGRESSACEPPLLLTTHPRTRIDVKRRLRTLEGGDDPVDQMAAYHLFSEVAFNEYEDS